MRWGQPHFRENGSNPIFLGVNLLCSHSQPSLFSPPFSVLTLPFPSQSRSDRQSQQGKIGNFIKEGVRGGAPATKAFYYALYFETKIIWKQAFWFFLWEPKCPSEVSQPKWASVQTTLCERTWWYNGRVTCTHDTGLGTRHEFGGSCRRCPHHQGSYVPGSGVWTIYKLPGYADGRVAHVEKKVTLVNVQLLAAMES